MNFLVRLTDSGLIHPSLLPILFGDLLDDEDYWYEIDNDIPRISRDVLLLYMGLIQAYCFARAHDRNVTLRELDVPKRILDEIENIWKVDCPDVFTSFGYLSSYLKKGTDAYDPHFFGKDAKEWVSWAFQIYTSLSSEDDENEDTGRQFYSADSYRNNFLKLLASLPLLRNTRFVRETMKFEFVLPEGTMSVKVSPFITFLNFEAGPIGEPVDAVTTNCYILTSVFKGDKNDELFFDTMRINETGSEMDKRKICRQVQTNENLMLLCKTAGLETQWYSPEDCWCDLKFLNKMVDATEQVLLAYCGVDRKEFRMGFDIRERLLDILMDTDLYSVLSERRHIYVQDLNYILFDLFLSEGLFKTVQCILINPPQASEATSRKMFELYLKSLADFNHIREEQIKGYTEACDNRIKTALEKLSHIIPAESAVYKKRELEIRAEWKTFYILQAAGIQANNLFADVESFLSIDDFYDMIGNSYTSLELDLMNILRMLCVFYGALLLNKVPFDEEKYYADAEKIAPRYSLSTNTLASLFDQFIRIAEQAEASSTVEELLGRKGFGLNRLEYLNYCRKQILAPERGANELPRKSTGYGIFISYAHEDYDLVKPIVDRWRKLGYSFFFDETDIHCGQSWIKIAEAAMDNTECKMVVAFVSRNSVQKSAVAHEIEHAAYISAKKFPNDPEKQSRFIVPVNLESEGIHIYLPELVHTAPDVFPSFQRSAARKIYEHMPRESVFITYDTASAESFDSDIRHMYEAMAFSDGRVVTSKQMQDRFVLAVANFYAFLKFGGHSFQSQNSIDSYFNNENADFSECIFPIVASVKEARIKRDHIAIVGYEMIRGKGRKKSQISHILTSRTLEVNDYYCIPKYRNSGEYRNWMVEPLLIRCDKFTEILNKTKESNNG